MKQVPKKSKKRNAVGTGTGGKRASSQSLDSTVRALLDVSPESMFLMDIDGTVIECNETTAARLGKTIPEIAGLCIYDYLPPDVSVERKEHVLEVIHNGKSITFEDTRGGRTFLNRIEPVFDKRGGVCRLAVFGMDITERKQSDTQRETALGVLQKQKEELEASNEELMAAEEELRTQMDELTSKQHKLIESERKFHDTIKYLDEGYYSVTPEGLLLEHNQAFNRILGFDIAQDVSGSRLPDFWQNPDDRRKYLDELTTYGFVRNFLINAKKISGEKIVVMASAHLLKDEKGRLARIDGTFTDFTERKREEEDLLLKNLVFDASIAANSIADLSGIITQANDAFLRLWGYSNKDEVVGRPLMDFISNEEEASAIINALNTGGVWEGDYTAKKKDVSTFIAHGLATAVRDGKGTLIGYQSAVLDVTESKRAEGKLRDEEERFRIAAESSNDVVYEWDLKQSLNWYGKIDEMLGYGPGEFPKTLDGWTGSVHPEDLKRTMAAVQAHLEDGLPYNEEYRVLTKDGATRWWAARGAAARTPDGTPVRWVGTVTDITESKRSEEELEKHREHLEEMVEERTAEITQINEQLQDEIEERSKIEDMLQKQREEQQIILDSVPAWIFYKDKENRFISVNNAFANVLGMSREQIEGATCFDLYPKEQAEAFLKDDLEVIDSGNPKRNIIEPMDRGTSTLWVQTDKIPYRDGRGTIIGIIGFTLDITDRKRAEDGIIKLNDELGKNVAKLEDTNKELEAFSYSISHDLRAPLRAIDGFTKILEDEYKTQFDDEGIRLLTVIRKNTRNMGQLIDDLLTFSRMGRQEIQYANTSMEGLARAVSDELQAASAERNLRITVSELPPAYCDRPMIRQVFFNLIANAVKFTRNREPAVIEIGSMREGDRHVYYVKDNGVGFDMQYAGKLFGVFQRLHSANEFEGTGVGLALTKSIILKHGGSVRAEGKVNEGATFYFSLPIKGETNGNKPD